MVNAENSVLSLNEKIQRWLTPNPDEQVQLILSGKCPHNKGWMFHSFGHNDKSYKCVGCGELKFY